MQLPIEITSVALKGKVILKTPTLAQKLTYTSEAGLSKLKDAKTDDFETMAPVIVYFLDKLPDHIESIDLVDDEGKKYKSVDELDDNPATQPALQEMALKLIESFNLGNVKRPRSKK